MTCLHGKRGKCLLCEADRIIKETNIFLKDVREFVEEKKLLYVDEVISKGGFHDTPGS